MLREGKRNTAYQDTRGIWTIGVGHTGPDVYKGLVWTDEQVLDALKHDLFAAETAINKFVRVPLNQNQFDALVSLVFNIGIGAFYKSTILRLLNEKAYDLVSTAFLMWDKPPEILGRRKSEQQQFLSQ